jgi:hypothetical protein
MSSKLQEFRTEEVNSSKLQEFRTEEVNSSKLQEFPTEEVNSSKLFLSGDTVKHYHIEFSLTEILEEIRETCYQSPILYICSGIKPEHVTPEMTINDIEFVYYPYIDLELCEKYSEMRKMEDESLSTEDNQQDDDDEGIFLGLILLEYCKNANTCPECDKFCIINAECDSYFGDLETIIEEIKDENNLQVDKDACARFLRFFDNV